MMIDEELDRALEVEAARSGRSKASVLRELARAQLRQLPALEADPLGAMAGVDDFEPASVDDVVYR